MDMIHVFLVVLFGPVGALSSSHNLTSGRVLEMMVRPGENITLYCDCKTSTGEFIVWYRNCSHKKQPSLVLTTKFEQRQYKPGIDLQSLLNPFPNFHLVKNHSSQSYDLLITNITDLDEGFYYCGTEQSKVKEKETINLECLYRYGNLTTRIVFQSPDSTPCHDSCVSSIVSRMMVLTPAFSIFVSFVSFVFVYQLCQKTEKGCEIHQKRKRQYEDEDLCLTQVMFQAQDGYRHQ
ncbi:E3 ubiquitin-protein ligase [Sarotherodon galilaeus]